MPAAQSVEKSLKMASQAEKKQDWLAAVQLNRSVLERFPGNKKAAKALCEIRKVAVAPLFQSASQASNEENWQESCELLEAAQFLAPENGKVIRALAHSYIQFARHRQALELIEPYLASHRDDAEAQTLLGHALHCLNQPEAAREALEQAKSLDQDNVHVHRLLGEVEQSQGNLNKAEAHFSKGLDVNPEDISLLRHIANVKGTVDPGDPLIPQMRQTLARLGANNPRSALLQFGLFEMLHKAGDHEAAYPYLQKGNELLAELHPYDFKSEAIVGAISKNLFPERIPFAGQEIAPRFIFVTGLPRTGTTLTERILSQNPRVQACGELSIVRHAVFEVLNKIKQRGKLQLKQSDIAALRHRMLDEFEKISDGSSVVVDKMPLNFRWIGYICAALPEARIVHMRRDPKAVAWSLYRQVFRGRGHDFIFSPDEIARFMVFHEDLMRHWREICGDRIFDLNYSDIVNDQLGATQSLAQAVGLSWNEDWMSPEKATNHVRTASSVQITKPIYGGSDEGWKTYQSQVGPLMAALSAAGFD